MDDWQVTRIADDGRGGVAIDGGYIVSRKLSGGIDGVNQLNPLSEFMMGYNDYVYKEHSIPGDENSPLIIARHEDSYLSAAGGKDVESVKDWKWEPIPYDGYGLTEPLSIRAHRFSMDEQVDLNK